MWGSQQDNCMTTEFSWLWPVSSQLLNNTHLLRNLDTKRQADVKDTYTCTHTLSSAHMCRHEQTVRFPCVFRDRSCSYSMHWLGFVQVGQVRIQQQPPLASKEEKKMGSYIMLLSKHRTQSAGGHGGHMRNHFPLESEQKSSRLTTVLFHFKQLPPSVRNVSMKMLTFINPRLDIQVCVSIFIRWICMRVRVCRGTLS